MPGGHFHCRGNILGQQCCKFRYASVYNKYLLLARASLRKLDCACVMPRDGAILFSDLIGKLDVLNVACEKCGRAGRYPLRRLIDNRGRDAKVIDWLSELPADCPKNLAHDMNDPCGAKCPDLPKVL